MENRKTLDGPMLAVLWVGLLVGYAAGAHAAVPGGHEGGASVQPAQATCTDSMSCCIQRNPLNAVEACGATALEVAETLAALRAAIPEDGEDGEGDKEREGPREWKAKCLPKFDKCKDIRRGHCQGCYDQCVGNRGKWPSKICPDRE